MNNILLIFHFFLLRQEAVFQPGKSSFKPGERLPATCACVHATTKKSTYSRRESSLCTSPKPANGTAAFLTHPELQ